MKLCVLIPCYDHGEPLQRVLAALVPYGLACLVVDDGSGPATQALLAEAAREFGFVRVHRQQPNQGKGVALASGFALAAQAGFSHVIQLDADGQHDVAALPHFAAAMEREPEALVLGRPRFDASAPRRRIWARQMSRVAVWIATRSFAIADPLCGMRGVPLVLAERVLASARLGPRMEFEPEFAVRCLWAGAKVVNVDVAVVYPEGGLSHFDVARDFPALLASYLRLGAELLRRLLGGAS